MTCFIIIIIYFLSYNFKHNTILIIVRIHIHVWNYLITTITHIVHIEFLSRNHHLHRHRFVCNAQEHIRLISMRDIRTRVYSNSLLHLSRDLRFEQSENPLFKLTSCVKGGKNVFWFSCICNEKIIFFLCKFPPRDKMSLIKTIHFISEYIFTYKIEDASVTQ